MEFWKKKKACTDFVVPRRYQINSQSFSCPSRQISQRYFRVVAGLTVLSQPGDHAQIRQIANIKIHQDYNTVSADNDIALLRLKSPLDFNDYVQPICTSRNESEEAALNFSHCFISGWGTTYYGG